MAKEQVTVLEPMVARGRARVPGWVAILADRLRHPPGFTFGVHDCWSWPMDIIGDMVGVDPLEPWRGQYRTPAQAFGLLLRHYGGSTGAFCRDRIGPQMSWSAARRGDLVEITLEGLHGNRLPNLGLVDTTGARAVHLTETGLHRAGLGPDTVRRCWRVGT